MDDEVIPPNNFFFSSWTIRLERDIICVRLPQDMTWFGCWSAQPLVRPDELGRDMTAEARAASAATSRRKKENKGESMLNWKRETRLHDKADLKKKKK